jgi:transcriptional regulator with XRE-family HTH domain
MGKQKTKNKPPLNAGSRGLESTVDNSVGARLRLRRNVLGMSQKTLAEKLGITFQQVQKYEQGKNRVSAGRLHDLARCLEVPLNYFYEDTASSYHVKGFSDQGQEPLQGEHDVEILLGRKESIDLIRAYYTIKDGKSRRKALKLLKAMADDE